MARPAFKSEKRKKELIRLKKQEEKRLKRLRKDAAPQPDTESAGQEETVSEDTVKE